MKRTPFFGFSINATDIDFPVKSKIEEIVHELENVSDYHDYKRKVTNDIQYILDCANDDNILDMSQIQEGLFDSYLHPDIFISHSSKDQELANKIGEQFYYKGLRPFLDYQCWKSIYHLEEILEKTAYTIRQCSHCKTSMTVNCSILKKSVRSSTTILIKALTQVLSQSKCVLFLNTENFLNNNNETESPWIYSEIETFNSLEYFYQQHVPKTSVLTEDAAKSMEGLFSNSTRQAPKIKYSPDFNCGEIAPNWFSHIVSNLDSGNILQALFNQISEHERLRGRTY